MMCTCILMTEARRLVVNFPIPLLFFLSFFYGFTFVRSLFLSLIVTSHPKYFTPGKEKRMQRMRKCDTVFLNTQVSTGGRGGRGRKRKREFWLIRCTRRQFASLILPFCRAVANFSAPWVTFHSFGLLFHDEIRILLAELQGGNKKHYAEMCDDTRCE